jgi:hypothetical protein
LRSPIVDRAAARQDNALWLAVLAAVVLVVFRSFVFV